MKKQAIPLLLLTSLMATPPTDAAIYYVDAAAGPHGAGTIPQPFLTIATAVLLAEPGDTISIRAGVYAESVTVVREGVTLAAWGASMPELRGDRGASLTIAADDCRVLRLRFSGAAGLAIDGVANQVRGCVFERCARPIDARGRAHVLLLNEVIDCQAEGVTALFNVQGPGSSVVWNRFVNNTGDEAAAVSIRGKGCVVHNNILSGDVDHHLRHAIVSESGQAATQFDSCTDQQITHNRIRGGTTAAAIRVAGKHHARSAVRRNTIVGLREGATGIELEPDGLSLEANLVGVALNRFVSIDPHHPAFLWPRRRAVVDRVTNPEPYMGARPVWVGEGPDMESQAGVVRNLSLGRPYLFTNVSPHGSSEVRPFCLTDGYVPNLMWGDKDGTDFTGWHMNGMDNRLFVWLDLGTRSTIHGVRVNVPHQHVWRAGMPLQIDIAVSDDDTLFSPAGSILPELPKDPGIYWVEVDGLHATGRYVLLTIYTDWSYTGLGEIEVLGTQAAEGTPSMLSGSPAFRTDDLFLSAGQGLRLAVDNADLNHMGRYRINKNDLAAAAAQAEVLEVRDQIAPFIDAAAEAVWAHSSPDARANPDVTRVIRRVSTAVLEAAYGASGLLVSSSTPYQKFSGSHVPARHEVDIKEVTVKACMDEREPGAFFVTNTTKEATTVRLAVGDLTSMGTSFPREQILLRSPVDFTIGDPDRMVKGDYFHDKNNAIVLLDHGEGNRLDVKAFDTRQVWICFDTTDVPAGTYRGEMTLTADGIDPILLRLSITVHPIRIPEQLDLHAYMWSYWGAPRVVNFRPEAFRDAIRHKANTILDHSVPHPVSLGEDGVDEQGHMLKPLNYDNLDWQIDTWNKSFRDPSNRVKFYIFWLAFGNEGYDELRMGIPVGSPRWNMLIVEWFNDIATHLQERHGMTTDQFAFYVQDELEPRQVLAYYEPMADALRAADPQRYPHARKVKLFVNPMTGTVMSSSWQHFEQRYDKLGLLAPLLGDYPDRILESFHRSGNLVWSHNTAGKSAGYGAKLSGWRCMQKGFGGMGFFIYIYSTYPSSYDRVYTKKDKVPGAGDETIVPTRGWEAWRDGQEDWYLLSLLKQTAHGVRQSGPDDFARGLEVFHGAIRAVFAAPDDPRVSVTAREKVIAEILRLRQAG